MHDSSPSPLCHHSLQLYVLHSRDRFNSCKHSHVFLPRTAQYESYNFLFIYNLNSRQYQKKMLLIFLSMWSKKLTGQTSVTRRANWKPCPVLLLSSQEPPPMQSSPQAQAESPGLAEEPHPLLIRASIRAWLSWCCSSAC